ncbi:MAG TPA: glycosyltransferase family 9 protein [Terriglobales bacterium]|jgi:heptosyltransferase-1|nr:glycosyltransferase family 9 protein [Terriglobales bacterium]
MQLATIAEAEQAEVMRRHQAEVQEVSQGPERLLIVRLGSMGDVIHALPAATLLRRAFPPATLGWMIEERWVELLCAPATPRLGPRNAGRPLVDAVHPVNTLGWRSAPFSGSTWKDVAGAWREVRAARYELAVDFQGAVRTSLMARWTGAEACIGFEHPREHAASLFYTHTVETQERHVIEQNAALAAAVAGVPAEVPAVEFPVDPAAEDSCERRLRLHAVRQFAILNPGAGWEGKQWPPERYGEVARGLAGLGLRCLINFGPGEEALARAAAAASAGAAEAVPTSLSELIAFTRRARLFIGGDTGPMHLAAALGVPVVALFGPTSPARNGPFRTRSVVLRSALSPGTESAERAAARSRRKRPDPGLLAITPQEVLAAARQLLESGLG